MRIFIVSTVFPPEPVVSSVTSAQLAGFLTTRGNDVSVVTGFPSRPKGKLYPGYKRRLYRREKTREGYRLIRCFAIISSKSTMGSRFLENISFGLTSGLYCLTARRPDAIYANTSPIFAAGIIALVSRIRGITLVLNIQDIYPESLSAQGRVSPSGIISRWLRKLDRWIVKTSAAVVVPAPSFVEVFRQTRQLPPEKQHFVPNWFDDSRIVLNDIQAVEFRRRLGVPNDAKMILYGGNVGVAAGVETAVESFRYLKEVKNLYLAIAGDGANLAACRKLAADVGHPGIRFHSPWPVEETSMALSAADILVLPTRGQQSLVSIPSKLIAYLLAARPILALSLPESDLGRIVNQSGCGWLISPDQPADLAKIIRKIVAQPRETLLSRGLAGRQYAISNFTANACLPKIADIIKNALHPISIAGKNQPSPLES